MKDDKKRCPEGYKCLARQNPDKGMTSFDNLFIASLMMF